MQILKKYRRIIFHKFAKQATIGEWKSEEKYFSLLNTFTYFILLFLLLFIAFFAFQNLYQKHLIATSPQVDIMALREELRRLTQEQEALIQEQEQLNANIQEERDSSVQRLDLSSEENEALFMSYNQARVLAGFTAVNGRGVRLTLQDKEGIRYDQTTDASEIVHDADLHFLVDWLKTQKPEAIQVNGERLSAMSPLLCVGSSVLVNRVFQSNPFVIEAVVEEDITNLLTSERYYQYMIERGLRLEIETVEEIQIGEQDDLIYVDEQIQKLGGRGNG